MCHIIITTLLINYVLRILFAITHWTSLRPTSNEICQKYDIPTHPVQNIILWNAFRGCWISLLFLINLWLYCELLIIICFFFTQKMYDKVFSIFKHEIPLSMSMTYSFFSHLVKALNVSCAVDDGSHSASLKTLQVSCRLSCRKWKLGDSLGLMLPIM